MSVWLKRTLQTLTMLAVAVACMVFAAVLYVVTPDTRGRINGYLDARRDVSRGHYRHLVSGLVATTDATQEDRQRNLVEYVYTGCVVFPGSHAYNQEYNRYMHKALVARFGTDPTETPAPSQP